MYSGDIIIYGIKVSKDLMYKEHNISVEYNDEPDVLSKELSSWLKRIEEEYKNGNEDYSHLYDIDFNHKFYSTIITKECCLFDDDIFIGAIIGRNSYVDTYNTDNFEEFEDIDEYLNENVIDFSNSKKIIDAVDKDIEIIHSLDEENINRNEVFPCIYRIANDCYSCT